MEMTCEQWKQTKKQLRRNFSVVGWVLLVYYGIMNAAVFIGMFVEMIVRMIQSLLARDLNGMLAAENLTAASGWGYFLAAAVGLIVLLCWKKPRYWREEIWAKGKPMTAGTFLMILCVFMSAQAVSQVGLMGLELLLNSLGFTLADGLESMSVDLDSFSMFLYSGVLAPVTEEILFRGVVQRTLMPYGKKFAIFCSAFTFGIFHGNVLQAPFAFAAGLILGYVASEYSIAWAMLLHMINNLVVADMLTRITLPLGEMTASIVIWAVLAAFAVAAVIVLIAKRKQIRAWNRQNQIHGVYTKCFFSSPGMIVLAVLMGISMVSTACMMITVL